MTLTANNQIATCHTDMNALPQNSWCSPHEPGGPPACRDEPGHCVDNLLITKRPTRQDMLSWLQSRQIA